MEETKSSKNFDELASFWLLTYKMMSVIAAIIVWND